MEITVNGEARHVKTDITLNCLVGELGLDPKTVAALLNDEVVERERFDITCIKAGDNLELVRFVPGG